MSGVNLYIAMLLMAQAQGPGWRDALQVLSFVVMLLLGIGQYLLNGKAKEIETLKGEVATLRSEIEARTTELVAAKFEKVRGDVELSSRLLTQSMDEMARRMEQGDRIFEQLMQRDQHNELQLRESVGQLQVEMLKSCVSKDDFNDFRIQVQEMGRKIGEQIEQVNVKLGRRS